jgi:FdhE protein
VSEGARDGAEDAVRLPDPARLFEARAARLRSLSEGHAAGNWLRLLARVAQGQRAAVIEVVPPPAPAMAREGAPLAPALVARDATWRRMLQAILGAASAPGVPPETVDTLRRLSALDAAQLEALAHGVLAGEVPPDHVACAPFVGAALQAWFAAVASRLDPASVPRRDDGCPVCGSPPVAGVIRGGDRRRHLSCALCASEWDAPRLRCTTCGREEGLAYFHAEGDEGARAEACSGCRAYLKLFDEERRPGAEPAADDAATLALDLRLAEEGWRRAGPNLYVGAWEPAA